MIVQPLAIIGSHFDSIAAGNLARPIAVYGRNEITAIFCQSEDHAAGFAWDGK
ncbi:methyl-accepting chemotaxis protein IV [Escherichia coli]|uniref:Methyl-accepting chemotaxis protein IV n=1 Tax=Escherichia coli TaxID=562 RepID=A0A377CEQ9_ECOLX|nr:methyl-accepting chemotaxis protein IV [Escherichia coli]